MGATFLSFSLGIFPKKCGEVHFISGVAVASVSQDQPMYQKEHVAT